MCSKNLENYELCQLGVCFETCDIKIPQNDKLSCENYCLGLAA